MNEFKTTDIPKIKNTESESYKEIKPQVGMTAKEAREFWNDKFEELDESKDIQTLGKEYIEDLKGKTEYPESISIDLSKLERQSPEKVKEMREEFDNCKIKLREEWEVQNGKPWPKYTEDVVNDKGVIIRREGDRYDAHHINPLCLGGKNEVSNLIPLDINTHIEVHLSDSFYTKLKNKVGGNL